MTKPVTAWCVTNMRGDLIVSTVRHTRVLSIKAMVGDDGGWRYRWRGYWYGRYGCRCVRVRLVAASGGA